MIHSFVFSLEFDLNVRVNLAIYESFFVFFFFVLHPRSAREGFEKVEGKL